MNLKSIQTQIKCLGIKKYRILKLAPYIALSLLK